VEACLAVSILSQIPAGTVRRHLPQDCMWIMSCPNVNPARTVLTAAGTSRDQYRSPGNAECVPSGDLILSEVEVASRMRRLAQLQAALETAGVRCVLARRHRLVLRYNRGPDEPSGLTDPELRLYFTDHTDTATTNGAFYRFGSGHEFPVADPSAAAEAIARQHLLTSWA
jgi:hypothetical protein